MFIPLTLLCGCINATRPNAGLQCTASVAENVQTVIEVSWTAPEEGTSWVVFEDGVVAPLTTPEATGTEVRLPLLGMPEDTDVIWRGTTAFADGSSMSCTGVTRTGKAPSDVPEVELFVDEDGQDDSRWLMGAFYTGAGGTGSRTQLATYRRDGTLVWYYDGAEGATSLDAHYASTGGIWFNEFHDIMGSNEAYIKRVSLTGVILDEHHTPNAHHMFSEGPNGILAYNSVDLRDFLDPETGTTTAWAGDGIVEVDSEGNRVQVFSTWDTLPAHQNAAASEASMYDGVDWTHGNMVSYAADTDEYTLSLGHATDVLTMNRTTREVTAIYGPDGLTVSPPFGFQHYPTWLENGNMLVFTGVDGRSGAVEYAVTDAGIEAVWASPVDSFPILSAQAIRLPNGNTVVNRDAGTELNEYQDDGTRVWAWRGTGGGIMQFRPISDIYTGEL